MTPAAEVYRVAGEDRPRRWWRWAVTLLAGYFQVFDAPAVSQVVIRRVSDDSIVRVLPSGTMSDFEAALSTVSRDLRTLDAVSFAEIWIAPPA